MLILYYHTIYLNYVIISLLIDKSTSKIRYLYKDGGKMKNKLNKIKTYIQSHTWLQYGLIWLGLLLMSVLGMNDNYHTLSWINRILPPYSHEGMTFFTGTILLIIAIYNLFRAFYYTTGNYLFNKGWKCFICTLIFVNLLTGINGSAVQRIRRFQSGLNAIYLDRTRDLSINLYDISEDGVEKAYRSEGTILLKNCSNKTVGPFKITVTFAPDEYQPGGSFTSEDIYELAPGKQKYIVLTHDDALNDFTEDEESEIYATAHMILISEGIEITLWNEEKQVTFYSE